ncbi:MAG: PPC domain-containing protein, partial [Bryobacteraceae bacterium]
LNLGNATAIYFDRAGVKGKIVRVKELPDLAEVRLGSNGGVSSVDLGPLPPRNQVTVEIDVSPEAAIGPVNFRLQNTLGTSPEGRFLVEPYYGESPDREPNNTPEQAFETYLPTILVGEIAKPGDVDFYKITAKAGEQLVFENSGSLIGSTLQPVISILREDESEVRSFGEDGGSDSVYFTHKFDKAGTYYIRVADYQQSGRASHTYRIKVGNFPLVTSAFPLGVQAGKSVDIALKGYDLAKTTIQVKGEPKPGEEDVMMIRPKFSSGASFSEVKLAIGRDPEVMSAGTNNALASAQAVTVPITINGRIGAPVKNLATENYYRFHARKGEKLMFEVAAKRLDSELDSLIEVVDAKGNPIEMATVRSIMETSTVLRDHDSATRGIRLASYTGFEAGDYFMIGNEICRVESMPLQPDADIVAESFGGQRIAYFGTSSETQAMDHPVYKVQMHPAGTHFTPNGLPIVHLYYRNDDGGPGFGKDSLLAFTAPAEGDYYVKIRDVRGLGGDSFAYRLNIRAPRPDFRLAVNPRNPNVPAGGTIPLTVTAFRKDGFDGKIDVSLEGLPAGLKATSGVIMPNQITTTLLLSAEESAKLETAAPLKVAGKARVGSETLAHYANPDDDLKLIALMPKPDIIMTAQTKEVTLEAGGSAEVLVSILRQNGFGGRVPVEVRNLPPRVRVPDVGLNGVLITEEQTQRSFTIEALPSAEPIEQMIYVSGKVETRSGLDSSYAAVQPILLKVKAKGTTLSKVETR